jgi:adenylate kinase family enzyme
MEESHKPLKYAVVGSSCAGKTTVSKIIAKKLGIKFVGIDYIHWLPNWTPMPDDELWRRIDRETAEPSWIIDGNYSRLQDLTLSRADVILWLNYSFFRVFYRALSRTISRIITKEELFPGCRESFYLSFCSKESILWWVITTWKKKNSKYRKIFDEKVFGDKSYIECRSQIELDQYVATL